MAEHVVARADEVRPGTVKLVSVAGREIGLFNVAGEFFALRNRCPHQGGPLCRGRLSGFLVGDRPGEYRYSRPGEILRCPWHGWEFDIRTGQSWFDPAKTRVRSYPVTVVAEADLGDLQTIEGLAKGPYVAETYPVSQARDHLVVDIRT